MNNIVDARTDEEIEKEALKDLLICLINAVTAFATQFEFNQKFFEDIYEVMGRYGITQQELLDGLKLEEVPKIIRPN